MALASEQEARDEVAAAIAQRQVQIDKFREQLSVSRARLSNRISALQDLTFKRFGGQAEAQFGGRGLQVTGGAFQSALAREAAGLQAEQEVEISRTEREDIGAEQGLRASLFGQRLSGLTGRVATEAGREDEARKGAFSFQKTLGKLVGGIATRGLAGLGGALIKRFTSRSIVRGPEGGAGEPGIKAFRTVIG